MHGFDLYSMENVKLLRIITILLEAVISLIFPKAMWGWFFQTSRNNFLLGGGWCGGFWLSRGSNRLRCSIFCQNIRNQFRTGGRPIIGCSDRNPDCYRGFDPRFVIKKNLHEEKLAALQNKKNYEFFPNTQGFVILVHSTISSGRNQSAISLSAVGIASEA